MSDNETLTAELKAACKRARQFQDKKLRELKVVHDIMDDDTLTKDEKFVSLVARGWGKQRAMQIVWGGRHEFR